MTRERVVTDEGCARCVLNDVGKPIAASVRRTTRHARAPLSVTAAAKQLYFNAQDGTALKKMQKGVDKLASVVGVTLGPKGRNVVLESKYGSPKIVNDGVTVAKEVDLEDPVENVGAKLVRQASQKTNDEAGDGTTTATVLAEAIYREGLKNVAAGANPVYLKRGIDKAVEEISKASSDKGKVVGAILSREVSDRLGRCTTLAVGSGLFFLGSLTLASSSTFGMLLLGRALLGLGVGTGLSIDPLYISEISPPAHRGLLVSWSEVSINLGIIAGFVSSYALSGLSPAVSWRLMVGLGAVLPVPMFLLSVFVMPESPRHLMRIGAGDRAARVLGRLVGAVAGRPTARRGLRRRRGARGGEEVAPPGRRPRGRRLYTTRLMSILPATHDLRRIPLNRRSLYIYPCCP